MPSDLSKKSSKLPFSGTVKLFNKIDPWRLYQSQLLGMVAGGWI
jgi:hypothetical protein